MINYRLPTEIEIDGKKYAVREKGDYRQILDVIQILNDNELAQDEKYFIAVLYFYEESPPIKQAVDRMMWFISCGEETGNTEESEQEPPLMNWEKDFNLIASAINKQGGEDIRAVPYLHWWSFISRYMEIEESTFSTFVSIRKKIQNGERLEKWESEIYYENQKRIDLE